MDIPWIQFLPRRATEQEIEAARRALTPLPNWIIIGVFIAGLYAARQVFMKVLES